MILTLTYIQITSFPLVSLSVAYLPLKPGKWKGKGIELEEASGGGKLRIIILDQEIPLVSLFGDLISRGFLGSLRDYAYTAPGSAQTITFFVSTSSNQFFIVILPSILEQGSYFVGFTLVPTAIIGCGDRFRMTLSTSQI